MIEFFFFFFQAEDGIRDSSVTGVQTCALPIYTTIGHITEANSPTAGKAITETFVDPNSALDRQIRAPIPAPISTLRLSNIFSNNIPTEQPAVSRPQNHETAAAPVV